MAYGDGDTNLETWTFTENYAGERICRPSR